jgi:hypothetical protein
MLAPEQAEVLCEALVALGPVETSSRSEGCRVAIGMFACDDLHARVLLDYLQENDLIRLEMVPRGGELKAPPATVPVTGLQWFRPPAPFGEMPPR